MSSSLKLTQAQLVAVRAALGYLMSDIETMSTESDRERYREALRGYNALLRLVAAATPKARKAKGGGAA